jgi:O-phosphoseryl-tRNA synthetase
MGKLDISKIIKAAKADYEKTWLKTAKQLPRNTKVNLKDRQGREHPLRRTVQFTREILLKHGFDEIENRTIISESDVYKQYGPEAPLILDRAFYLATLPRPDIGMGHERIKQIESIIGTFDPAVLQEILREYKQGHIESDNFTEELVKVLGIKEELATRLEEEVFQEFKELTPESSNQTLRSHMTAGWYATLESMQSNTNFPIALFSVGARYRNEQREDAGHLRVHNSGSIVIMDPDMSLEAGREIITAILHDMGFKRLKFVRKLATSKYYAAGQEEEIFTRYKGSEVEICDIGMYSPISLSNYGIEHPVFNAGFGIERLAMILEREDDIRKLVYPQFGESHFTELDIVRTLKLIEEPKSQFGKQLADEIEEVATQNKDKTGPCELVVHRRDGVVIKIMENEEGKKLVGPAAFNEVCIGTDGIYSDLKPSGSYSGYNYLRAIAQAAAARIENAISSKELPFEFKVKNVRYIHDVNLDLPLEIRQYLESRHKKIFIRGPVFIHITAEYEEE